MKHIQTSFQAAVETLVGEGSVKQRLRIAFEQHLVALDEAEMPPGVREDYCRLHKALQKIKPIGPQNRVRATVQKMSAAEAASHAVTIFSLHLALEGRKPRTEPLRVSEPLQFADRAIAAAPRYLEKQK
ncbi:MAG TPA: hypothetical protein VKQ06_00265 [Gammaproteobacteria bacterium]|nr:hypothetical protein [Gammaproteobacteria bacterium]